MTYKMKHPKGKGFPFKDSPLSSHNDIFEGDPGFEAQHIKNADGDWVPMSAAQEEEFQKIKETMPDMSDEAINKVVSQSKQKQD